MSNYSADQISLRAHLEAEAAKTAAWCAEAEGRWACSYTTDLDHWAEMDVCSIEDLRRHDAEATYSDTFKEINGFRDRHHNLDNMSTEAIEAMNEKMFARADEEEKERAELKAEEAAHEARLAVELGVSLETYKRWQEKEFGDDDRDWL